MNATLKMTPFHVFFGRPPPPSGPPQLTEDLKDGGVRQSRREGGAPRRGLPPASASERNAGADAGRGRASNSEMSARSMRLNAPVARK